MSSGGRRADGPPVGRRRPADAIAAILAAELERRWELTERATLLPTTSARSTPASTRSSREAHDEFWFQHQRIELRQNDPSQGPAFVAAPRDRLPWLVRRLAVPDPRGRRRGLHRPPHPRRPGFFQEALDDGAALPEPRRRVVMWTLVPAHHVPALGLFALDPAVPHRLRENGRLAPYGSRGHEATIIAIDATPTDAAVALEWTTPQDDAARVRVGAKPVGRLAWAWSERSPFRRVRCRRTHEAAQQPVWKAKDGPGAWLTHGGTAPRRDHDDEGSRPPVDDIRQIEDGSARDHVTAAHRCRVRRAAPGRL